MTSEQSLSVSSTSFSVTIADQIRSDQILVY